ncbi:heme/hemin ABC transporter substrate-binding protein [Actinomyces urogenitalis]|uniref:heme/hemin ABC transporter substrate-binding protein n=1 Tax=Actinomyces urogenitalis TaxID=103621 RepID=UPI00242DCE0C|nr:ABC transporter substrate-binding protein [Actinomyces urogenitalis]MCI7456262.1 ABC transporter substrate-binding protein [Actinomyces urogenitalis]
MTTSTHHHTVTHALISRRRLLLGTAALGSAGALAACGVGAEGSASSTTAASAQASPGTTTPSAASWSVPDPRSLTGLSTAATLGDIEPVASEVSPTLPVTVTDHDGNEVAVSDVSRIIALDLTGNLSRTLAGLGLAGNIVGRTVSSTEPALAALPVVTSNGHELNVEAVLSLSPTLVLADVTVGTRDLLAQLSAAGVAVVITNPDHTVDSLRADIEEVGAAVGLSEVASQLAQRSEQELAQAQATIAQWTPQTAMRGVFLYMRGTAGIFFILGKGEAAAALLSGVGAEDAATAQGLEGIVPATAEAVTQLDPEVIFCMADGLESAGGLEGLMAKPGIAQTTAGTRQRVVAIPDGQSLAFGPQSGQILLETARALYQPVEG